MADMRRVRHGFVRAMVNLGWEIKGFWDWVAGVVAVEELVRMGRDF